MRFLDEHKINPANDTLTVEVLDYPGSGGASHCYAIRGFDYEGNPSCPQQTQASLLVNEDTAFILFQNGPIETEGVNGITHEALLAILCDRLRAFQAGPYACRENALALTKLEEAQHWLHHRTRARMARGVEGTHKV